MDFYPLGKLVRPALPLAILCFLPPAFAQKSEAISTLTLPQAVSIALEKNPDHKAALADVQAASADISEARSALLPHAAFSETATEGNDPVYVFGNKLRQQRFTAGDFALNALNIPDPYGNFSTRVGGNWNLFDSFASWRAVHRAEYLKDAAGHQLDRADQEIIFGVIQSYYEVLLAKRQVDVAEQAQKTAQAVLDSSQARVDSGLVVQADLLSAQVRMAARKSELISARDDLELARADLSSSMGLSAEEQFEPAEALEEKNLPPVSLEDTEKQAIEMRPDLKRIHSDEQAQHESGAIAKSSFGPRVNAYGGWEADNPTFVAGGGGNSWIAGIELQFDLFDGGSKRAQLAHERANEEKVAAGEEAATNAVRLEVRRAYYNLDAAREQVAVARAAVAQAQESLRINQDRYDSGVSRITDLLAAEDAARQSQTDYWQAIYRYQSGYARLELAMGSLSTKSAVVNP